jgi:hypothetical protein
VTEGVSGVVVGVGVPAPVPVVPVFTRPIIAAFGLVFELVCTLGYSLFPDNAIYKWIKTIIRLLLVTRIIAII